jgi:hypothetical protein
MEDEIGTTMSVMPVMRMNACSVMLRGPITSA